MKLLDLTLATPPDNLSLDEALLESADERGEPSEVLRLWESPTPIIVVGRSSQVNVEVHRSACEQDGVPIFRRSSGGAAIVAGPGCLMYAVVLSYEIRPELQVITNAHEFVLGRIAAAIRNLGCTVEHQGTSDLTSNGKKISGNSMRCKRNHLLYHGTLLYNFDLTHVSRYLGTPPRQPDYRIGRDHERFVNNLSVNVNELRDAIIESWNAHENVSNWPLKLTKRLAQEKYTQHDWNFRR